MHFAQEDLCPGVCFELGVLTEYFLTGCMESVVLDSVRLDIKDIGFQLDDGKV